VGLEGMVEVIRTIAVQCERIDAGYGACLFF